LNSFANAPGVLSDLVTINLKYLNDSNKARQYALLLKNQYPNTRACENAMVEIEAHEKYWELLNKENMVKNEDVSINSYPNPFNPITNIEFTIPRNGNVEIEIYNILGQLVDALHNGYMRKGKNIIEWNGQKYSSGIYFIRMKYENRVISRKIILMK